MRIRSFASLSATLMLTASFAIAQGGIGPITTSVPKAKKREGTPATKITQGYKLKLVVSGDFPLENPSGVITTFGALSTGVSSQPDQNTYLVTDTNPGGPTPGFDYGRHFLFQGHEIFSGDIAYVTRINLDVKNKAHKITLLTPVTEGGLTHINALDGSTYNPFSKTLFFTQEAGTNGGVVELNSTWPANPHTLDGILGKAGYEGIHPDDLGNLIIIEDTGGSGVSVNPADINGTPKAARQPNSFVFRFVPNDATNISAGGKLQALQVSMDGSPLVFHAGAQGAFDDTHSVQQLRLHTPGTSYPVQWVTIHDTDIDGTASFDANAAAKSHSATPFKRPENMKFMPGAGFRTFFFANTGDTNADSGNVVSLKARGAWGSIMRVDLAEDRASGTISLFALGDQEHNSFDNLSFADSNTILAAEDRGDGLHIQLNTLDSVWAYALDGSAPPRRLVALGRDASAITGNEDNEPTGIHVSAGNPNLYAIPGEMADLFNARAFLTKQHGDQVIWEIQQKF
jgi:hypothetical protein